MKNCFKELLEFLKYLSQDFEKKGKYQKDHFKERDKYWKN